MKKAIIIVSSDFGFLKETGISLTKNGFEVLPATSGSQAIRIIETKLPDLVLLDAVNPVKDLENLCSTISCTFGMSRIPLLAVISGQAVPAYLSDECRMKDVFFKNGSAEELLYRIRKLLATDEIDSYEEEIIHALNTQLLPLFEKIKSLFSKGTASLEELNELEEKVTLIESDLKIISDSHRLFKKKSHADLSVREVSAAADLHKLLVVEDNKLNRLYLGTVLSEAGYEVSFAGTGNEALEYLKDHSPDLILLDYSLPDMNGPEVLEIIRSENKTMPVIAVSGYTEAEIKQMSPSAKFDSFILKPVNNQDLVITIGNILESQVPKEEYSYARAVKISGGNKEQIQNWMNDFLVLVKQTLANEGLSPGSADLPIDGKLLHGLLNYSIYFGADQLKKIIWGYKNCLPDNSICVENQKQQLRSELIRLQTYYDQVFAQM